MNAKVSIDELNEALETHLPEDDNYETLGGFLAHITDDVPQGIK